MGRHGEEGHVLKGAAVGSCGEEGWHYGAADVGRNHLQGIDGTLGIEQGSRRKTAGLKMIRQHAEHGGLLVHHGEGVALQEGEIQLCIAALFCLPGILAGRMTGGNGQKQLLFCQQGVKVIGTLLFGQGKERKIQFAASQHLLLVPDAVLVNVDGDFRIVLMEQRVNVGEHGTAVFRGDADGEGSTVGVYQILKPLICLMADLQNLPGGSQVDMAGLGGGPAIAGTVKERGSNLPFQIGNLLGQGGRGNKELFRSPVQLLFFGDGDDIFDFFEIHRK